MRRLRGQPTAAQQAQCKDTIVQALRWRRELARVVLIWPFNSWKLAQIGPHNGVKLAYSLALLRLQASTDLARVWSLCVLVLAQIGTWFGSLQAQIWFSHGLNTAQILALSPLFIASTSSFVSLISPSVTCYSGTGTCRTRNGID